MEPGWIAVLCQVTIECVIGGPIDLVTVEDTESSVACVELVGDSLVDLRLSASVIAHQNHPVETVEERLLRQALEHGGEQLVRDSYGAGNRFCIVRSVGNTGRKMALPSFLAIASTVACAMRLWPPFAVWGPRSSTPPV